MARGSVVRRASGTWAVRYYGADKRRHYETVNQKRLASVGMQPSGNLEKDADRYLTARLRQLDTGTWWEPTDDTLRAYTEGWLEHRDPARVQTSGRNSRTRISAATWREYKRSLDLYVLPTLGSVPLTALRAQTIDNLIARLESRGLAAGTIRNALTPLRRLLNDAVRQGLIPANPAAKADLPPAQDFTGKEAPAEHTEAIRGALVKRAPLDPIRRQPDVFYVHLFDVALGTGLRLGELRALRWRDVDRERKLIRVDRAYSRSHLTRPKTEAGLRSVPLFPSVLSAIEAMAARAVERGRYAPDELVFSTANGTPIPPSHLHAKVWTPALKVAGLGEWVGEGAERRWVNAYRFHDLRHTCVSRLVAAGADVKLVQAVAGHANPLVTLKRYSHLLDARVTEAAERFDPAGIGT